jgi:hypothetical protein
VPKHLDRVVELAFVLVVHHYGVLSCLSVESNEHLTVALNILSQLDVFTYQKLLHHRPLMFFMISKPR